MKSAKCPQCGFVGWADAESCKKCGAHLAVQPVDGSDDPAAGQTVYYAPPPGGFQPDLKQGLAVTALVVGILNCLFLGIFGITIIAGIVISVIAMKQIKRYPHLYGGKSFALTGLIMNIASVVLLIPLIIVLSIALPNLYASRRAANEGSAINSLRKIHAAEATYQATEGRGFFGTAEDLEREQLIAAELASGTRHGYRFRVEVVKDTGEGLPGFIAVAVPTDYGSTGKRSFFVDQTGVIRAADSQGMEATKYDPPVNFDRETPSNRSASRRSPAIEAANEGSAINSLRQIHAAEATYRATEGRGAFGTWEDLQREKHFAADLASGTRHGYRFRVEVVNDNGEGRPGFIAVAVPTDYGSTGKRSFFVDQTGVIRAADSRGMEATKYDPPAEL